MTLFKMPLEAAMGEPEELGIEIDESPALSDAPEVPSETGEAATPATPEEPPVDSKVPETDDPQQKIAKYAFEARAAKRKAEAAEQALAELRKAQAQTPRPEVPAMPDPLAVTQEQFEQHMAQRDKAIRDAAAYDAHQEAIKAQERAAAAAREQERAQALDKAVEGYNSRAARLGVKTEELRAAGMMVGQFITDPNIGEMIVNDDQGPLITKYLSQNYAELEAIAQMSPYQAYSHIANVIKPKAASLKPKVSTAPPPQDVVGSGIIPRDYGVPGATFE